MSPPPIASDASVAIRPWAAGREAGVALLLISGGRSICWGRNCGLGSTHKAATPLGGSSCSPPTPRPDSRLCFSVAAWDAGRKARGISEPPQGIRNTF